jgi:uncharacterized protein YndB with AHSA1/START domain
MTTETVRVQVVRRFEASAERVFDAWLDPKKAATFLFTTPGGTMVRADIDPRVGGAFRFVDRRDGQDVEHTGTYLEIDRPRRLVFTFAVPTYSPATTRVTIDIVSIGGGCELTLTHEGVLPDYAGRTESGWTKILDGLASGVSDRPPTCGAGLAANAPLPETTAALFSALASVLDAHQQALDLRDEDARPEHDAYLTLMLEFRVLATQLESTARRMRGYADLPMGRHDMETLSGVGFRQAFERYVRVERELLDLLRGSVGQHEAMLAGMRGAG